MRKEIEGCVWNNYTKILCTYKLSQQKIKQLNLQNIANMIVENCHETTSIFTPKTIFFPQNKTLFFY